MTGAAELLELGYLELFQRLDQTALDRVWRDGAGRDDLLGIVAGPDEPVAARFLAAEILFAREPGFPRGTDPAGLAASYAAALAADVTGMANPWGLPGALDGPVARHVLALGSAAVPAFTALLDDDTRLAYGGSKEATVGNSYRYRVKDVAASLVARIRGLRHPTQIDPAARDTDIDRLRQQMG